MMKRTIILIISFALVLCCGIAPKKIITAKLSFISGKSVSVVRGGETKKAELNMLLKPADVVQTDAGSEARIVFKDIGISRIRENSSVAINDIFDLATGEQVKMKITKGKIISSLKKLSREKSSFEVHTPTAVVGVRGASVRGEKKSEVAVFEGRVEVKNAKKIKQAPVIVRSSEKTVVNKDKPPEKPSALGYKNFEEWAVKLEDEEKYLKDDFIKW